ncbi:hypothetical protein BELL_0877g00060 [Botrytis elliptica]|uniref:Uncharacterized protein n=1 Tax=Botrytis elliptica TaxID=278938 RepID=A0A4Z1J238_9HELO|nr:hypothetical protein EAE99_009970 [Botrytis elliptica]TGO67656.1 hypothetical protein BELL_0877g00060 [Botrytis elliptica]
MNNAPPRHPSKSGPSRLSSNIKDINTAHISQDTKHGIDALEVPKHQSESHSHAKIGGSKDLLDQEPDMYNADSDEFPENLITTGTRANPSKSKLHEKRKQMVLEDDTYEAGNFSERSDQSSTNPSPKAKRNKGKGIALPSDDETSELGLENVPSATSSSPEWTEEDQILLDCTYDYELALWRRTRVLFDCAPYDLFPTGIKAASDHWEGYNYKGKFIKNETSLTIPFCKSFCTLVCFPYFDGNIEFVKYALSTALKARCGDQIPNTLEGMNTWSAFEAQCDGLFKDMNRAEIYLTQDQLSKFKTMLASRTSLLDLPRNSGFVDTKIFKGILKSTRTSKEKGDSIHLLNGDIQNVIKAWDVWNKDSRKYLPSMEDSKDSWQKGNVKAMKVPRDIVLGWKKDWILKKRHRDIVDMSEGDLGNEDGQSSDQINPRASEGVTISEDMDINMGEDDEENQRLMEIERKILEIENKRLEVRIGKRGRT